MYGIEHIKIILIMLNIDKYNLDNNCRISY